MQSKRKQLIDSDTNENTNNSKKKKQKTQTQWMYKKPVKHGGYLTKNKTETKTTSSKSRKMSSRSNPIKRKKETKEKTKTKVKKPSQKTKVQLQTTRKQLQQLSQGLAVQLDYQQFIQPVQSVQSVHSVHSVHSAQPAQPTQLAHIEKTHDMHDTLNLNDTLKQGVVVVQEHVDVVEHWRRDYSSIPRWIKNGPQGDILLSTLHSVSHSVSHSVTENVSQLSHSAPHAIPHAPHTPHMTHSVPHSVPHSAPHSSSVLPSTFYFDMRRSCYVDATSKICQRGAASFLSKQYHVRTKRVNVPSGERVVGGFKFSGREHGRIVDEHCSAFFNQGPIDKSVRYGLSEDRRVYLGNLFRDAGYLISNSAMELLYLHRQALAIIEAVILNGWMPMQAQWVVGSSKLRLATGVDLVAWDPQMQVVMLIEVKKQNSATYFLSDDFFMRDAFAHVPDSDANRHQVQLAGEFFLAKQMCPRLKFGAVIAQVDEKEVVHWYPLSVPIYKILYQDLPNVVAKVEKLGKVEKAEKGEKIEKVEKVEQVEQVKNLAQVENAASTNAIHRSTSKGAISAIQNSASRLQTKQSIPMPIPIKRVQQKVQHKNTQKLQRAQDIQKIQKIQKIFKNGYGFGVDRYDADSRDYSDDDYQDASLFGNKFDLSFSSGYDYDPFNCSDDNLFRISSAKLKNSQNNIRL